MRLVLLGQPGDALPRLASELSPALSTAPPFKGGSRVEIIACDAIGQAPDWLALGPQDLMVLVERSPIVSVNWRQALMGCSHSYQVIHPSEQPLRQALEWTLGHHLHRITGHSPWPMREEIAPRWQGVCESCSDPECEHRLFQRLLQERTSS